MLASFCVLLFHLAGGTVHAQNGWWDLQRATSGGYDKSNPRIAVDQWGITHLVWASNDPNRSGLQLFYSTDATGQFNSPIQVTDTGNVYDSATVTFKPWTFRLDRFGGAHVGFIANFRNRLRLFYTSNANPERAFGRARQLTDSALQYGMAVDSFGVAHFVWVEYYGGAEARFVYWNSREPGTKKVIATRECVSGPGGCYIGLPEVEIGRDGIVVAYRSDSGSVYLIRQIDGAFRPITPASPTPGYDAALTRTGKADLRMRMSIDMAGAIHILATHFDSLNRQSIFHLSDAGGSFAYQFLATALDSLPSDLDLAYNGANRLSAVWTAFRPIRPWDIPRIGYAELLDDGHGRWKNSTIINDLNDQIHLDKTIWKTGCRIASAGDRVVVCGIEKIASERAQQQISVIARMSVRPVVRYILPDAAAAGMNVVVETYAHPREKGSFGADGMRGDAARLECVNPADNDRLVIGPSVVSWEGRLVSTMIFVKGNAASGPVPLRLRIGDALSNADTFFIVQPQHIGGPSGHLSGDGLLGSGGIYGRRSKRGVLVVDSLILSKGTFSVDTADTDPLAPGNQGFLPMTILSRGSVRIDSGAMLSVAATHDLSRGIYGQAGPGGGGGGTGGERGIGSGYTGGASAARIEQEWLMGVSTGSGGTHSGEWNGGGSLSGTPGGASYTDATGGGGTGHPFGTSGSFGAVTPREPVEGNVGGFGGGTGGAKAPSVTDFSSGGGGGGFGTPGRAGGAFKEDNGGRPIGTIELVPMAGGSGGGGGGYSASGYASGGGGGGALALFSYSSIRVDGRIDASGADGIKAPSATNASGGGAGSGGGLLIGSQGPIAFGAHGTLRALGGNGGEGYTKDNSGGRNGGDGGNGRIRIDGHRVTAGTMQSALAPEYMGPGTDGSGAVVARPGSILTGYGMPGGKIRIYTRTETGNWSYAAPYTVTADANGVWRDTLGPEASSGRLYMVAMQQIGTKSSGNSYAVQPEWVMSASSGAMFGRPAISLPLDSIAFSCIHFRSCDSSSIIIGNPGYVSDLVLSDMKITGPGAASFSLVDNTLYIPAGSSRPLTVRFCPTDTGRFTAELAMRTNLGGDMMHVHLSGCAISGLMSCGTDRIDLGETCLGEWHQATIAIRNNGAAPMMITRLTGLPADVTIGAITPALPLVIGAGSGKELSFSFLPKRLDTAGLPIRVISNTVDSIFTIRVRGVNAGPDIQIPATVDFGEVAAIAGDSCQTASIVIGNRNARSTLRLGGIALQSSDFMLLDAPPAGTEIAPGGSLTLHVRYCVGAPGPVSASLRVTGNGGDCTVDTVVRLTATGVRSKGYIVLLHPKPVRMITLHPALVGMLTNEDSVVIANVGGTSVPMQMPRILATMPGVFSIRCSAGGFPKALDPGASYTVYVSMKPDGMGVRAARLMLATSDGSWNESLRIQGEGVMPGFVVNTPSLEFGNTRVHPDSSEAREVMIYNGGGLPVTIDSIVLRGSADFILKDSLHAFPDSLFGGTVTWRAQDTMRLYYFFKPGHEGAQQATVTIYNSTGYQPTVSLSGHGVLEHLSGNLSRVDFNCLLPGEQKDSVGIVTVTNTGNYPMDLRAIRVDQSSGASNFRVTGGKVPDIIKAGESRTYSVIYKAGDLPAAGTIVFETSAPESYGIGVSGTVCSTEERTIDLMIPNRKERVGAYVELPILIRLPIASSTPIAYSFTLDYAYDLLAPLLASRSDARPLNIANAVSSEATMTQKLPGTLVISGTIAAGRSGDTLLSIPFKVLLGSTYHTAVTMSKPVVSLPSMRVNLINGMFDAVDCDTSGNVILLGNYALGQNRPNPFTKSTVILYTMAKEDNVRLVLYNDKGEAVRLLLNEVQSAGEHQYLLNDPTLPSGIYTYEMVSGYFHRSRQMIVIE
ncbi:MAG: choice-of-anchor D domain-containing protein [Candidatus Kapaibacterium sp.]